MTSEARKVWVAFTNSDLTEGRGHEYAYAICHSEATAKRLGKGRYVQGLDCPVRQVELIAHQGGHFFPINYLFFHHASAEDRLEQEKIDREREKAKRKSAALQKAREAGLSADEIEALRN